MITKNNTFVFVVIFLKKCIIKQLLDTVFVISEIIKVEVSVISRTEGRG